MKWLCVLVLNSGLWSPVRSVTRTPRQVPSIIEEQAKFFQDFFSVQLSPYKIEFGHVCEDPNTWEQRYEKKDLKNHRDMGKVRWGDKKGGYGEHYWDLNHAVPDGNQKDDGDDGSYHDPIHSDGEQLQNDDGDDRSYRKPHNSDEGEQLQNNKNVKKFDTNEYNPEKYIHYHDIARKKRDGKIKTTTPKSYEVKIGDELDYEEEEKNYKLKKHKKSSHHKQDKSKSIDFDPEVTTKPLKFKRHLQEYEKEEVAKKRDKDHVILVINQKHKEEQEQKQSEPKRFVPYEGGAGVRQHVRPEIADASIPRLYLEPSTGHVIDRTTGHAYVLQPVNLDD